MSLPSNRLALNTLTPSYIHPEVMYWRNEWELLRDCVAGEMEIKSKGTQYLPKLDEMSDTEYNAYIKRAVFFNMVNRTITGLVGRLFRRPPMIEGLPSRLTPFTETITKTNQGIDLFAKKIAEEVFTVGRYGVLLDMDQGGTKPPYLVGYSAENIMNWTVEELDGRDVLTEVVLREIRLVKNVPIETSSLPLPTRRTSKNKTMVQNTPVTGYANKYIAAYRVLRLEYDEEYAQYVYKQYYYENQYSSADINGEPKYVVTPTRRGVPFTQIPFSFFGPKSNEPDIEKPPIQDIARLNLSHYNSYAHLEHGRFYTGLPVYYVNVTGGNDQAEYTIGPSVVWLIDKDSKAGVIEFNGQGLKFLENALRDKEMQAATLGGRLMGVTTESTAESDNSLKMKESNEQALLLNVSDVIDNGLTKLLRLWAWWQDVSETEIQKIEYILSKSFIFDSAAAREFRAIHAMYKDGVLPVQVLYDYFRRAEVIPDWMKMEEFVRLLNSSEGFPGNPDKEAKNQGLPDAKTVVQIEENEKDRDLQRELARIKGQQSTPTPFGD